MFAREAKELSLDAVKATQALDADMAVVNHVLFYPEAGGAGPQQYLDGYKNLKEWVHSSLDLYKSELERILYPVFVHCYLDLVERGYNEHAARLLKEYRIDHEEQHGTEVKQLAGISQAAHVANDALAVMFRRHKFNVRLSAYAWELLLSFLHSSQTLLLLGLINERLGVTLVPGAPEQDDGSPDFGADAVTLTGESSQREMTINEREVRWGALKGSVELKAAKAVNNAAVEARARVLEREEDAKTFDGPGDALAELGPKKKSKKEIMHASKRAGDEAAANLVGPLLRAPKVESCVPMPKLRDDEELAQIAEIRRRVRLSARAPPSCAFFTLCNTYGGLNSVAISVDGQRVAGGFADSQVRVWSNDADAARVVSDAGKVAGARPAVPYVLLTGHSAPVYGVAFSPDGEHLLSGGADCSVRLWSMELQTCLCVYTGHAYPVWDVQWSPVGHYFATASHDRTARLWATNRTTPLRVFAGHLCDVDCVTFHPNANYVATGSSDKTARLWEVQTGECARLLTGHRAALTAIAISPAGRVLVSGDALGHIMCWDLANGKRFGVLSAHAGPVWSLVFSGESSVLASGGADCAVGLWDMEGGQPGEDEGAPRGGGAGGSGAAAGGGASESVISGGADHKDWRGAARLLTMLRTKQTPVQCVRFTRRNLLLGAGPFTRQPKRKAPGGEPAK